MLILALAVVLAACGDTATPQTITLPATTAAAGNAGNGGTSAGAGSNAGQGQSQTGGAASGGNNPAPTVDVNAKVEIPTIPDTTEIQVSASSLANAGPFGRFLGGASSGISPTVKVYASNDDVATLTKNVTTTLESAGFARAGGNRGGAGGFRGGNGTPRAGNGTPRTFNGTPRAGNGTPGANGFGGPGGQRGGLGIYTKQGDADILFTVMQVPTTTTQTNNGFFSNLDQATQQQLQGKKSVLIVVAAPGLAQNLQRGFANGGFGGGNGGNGNGGQGQSTSQDTPTTTSS